MVPTRPSGRRGDSNVAVLLTWFLPGSGHLYLGRTAFGLIALAVVEGLYVLGWFLCDGRTFEYLDPELRGPLATLLTPEAGNLGAMLLHLKTSSFGVLEPVPFPPAMVLGSFLTALSGVLNVFLAAHAHLFARSGKVSNAAPQPAFLLVLAWLVPGLAHWRQGRRRRGLLVFALLFGLFALGTWLAAGTNLSRERHFYYWSGQFLLGAPALLGEVLFGRARVTGELPWADVGLLYACMAGLLNVLAMLDVCGVAEKRWLEPSTGVARAETDPPSTGEVPA